MRGFFRSEPKSLAVFTNSNARSYSVRTRIPGDIFQFEFVVLFSQNPSSWQYLPVRIQGVCRSGPKCLAVFTDLDARCLSIRNKIPGDICQCKCEAFLWSEPKPLAIFRRLNARRFSARTKIPGDIYQIECAAFSARTAIAGETSQSKCGAFVGQDRNSWQYFPV